MLATFTLNTTPTQTEFANVNRRHNIGAAGYNTITTTTAPYRGEIGQLLVNNAFANLADPATLARFCAADGEPVDMGADGSLPFGAVPLIYFNGEATAANFGQVQGSLTFTMLGRGVDPSIEDPDKLAFFPQTVIDDALNASWTDEGSIIRAERSDYAHIHGQAITLTNSIISTAEGINRVINVAADAQDLNRPIIVNVWLSGGSAPGTRIWRIRLYNSSASDANYGEVIFALPDGQNMGPQQFTILPVWFTLAPLSEGSGYLSKGCSVTQVGTGWNRASVTQRVRVLVEDSQSHDRPGTPDPRKWAYLGMQRGYPHTPCYIINQDDGRASMITQLHDPGTGAVGFYAYANALGLRHGVNQIGRQIGEAGSWTLAQWNDLMADGLLEVNVHSAYSYTTELDLVIPYTGSGFVINATLTSSAGGSATILEVLDGILIVEGVTGTFATGNTLTDGTGSGAISDTPRAPLAADYIAVMDNEIDCILTKGAIPPPRFERRIFVYPQGGFRNNDAQGQPLFDAMAARMDIARSTIGFYFGAAAYIGTPAAKTLGSNWGVMRYSVGGVGIEDTDRFTAIADVTERLIGVTAQVGGCFWLYYHNVLLASDPRGNSSIPVDELFAVGAAVAAEVDSGRAKNMYAGDYMRLIDAEIGLVDMPFNGEY